MKLQSYPVKLFDESKEHDAKAPINIRVPNGSLFLRMKALFTGFFAYYLISEGEIDMSESETHTFLLPKNDTSIDPKKWEIVGIEDFIYEKPDGETIQLIQPIFKSKTSKK